MLGHPSDNILGTALSFMNSSDVFNKNSLVTHCKHCLCGKIHKLPFNKSDFQSTKSFELIHSDVQCPAPLTSANDFRYYVLFIDDYSKFSWVYLIKYKFDVFDIFKYFKAYVETQFDSKIKVLRSDGGGEYTSNAFK